MNVIASKAELMWALNLACSVAQGKGCRPILQCALLDSRDGMMRVQATNLDVSCAGYVRCEVIEEKPVLVNADMLRGIVSTAGGEMVTLNSDERHLHVESGKSRSKIGLVDEVDQFPMPDTLIPVWSGELAADVMSDALKCCQFAIAASAVQYAMTGLCINVGKDKIEFAATDTHRLSVYSASICDYQCDDEAARTAVIMRGGLPAIDRAFAGADGDISIRADGKCVVLENRHALVHVQQIQGKFPRYRDIIMAEPPHRFMVPRTEILQGLALMSQFGAECRFMPVSGGMRMVGEALDGGEGDIVIPCEMPAEIPSTCVSVKYLGDAVRSTTGANVNFEMKDNRSPMQFRGDDPAYLHVMMPVNS